MKKTLIDFLQWFFDNEPDLPDTEEASDYVDVYLKSINDANSESPSFNENENDIGVCLYDADKCLYGRPSKFNCKESCRFNSKANG